MKTISLKKVSAVAVAALAFGGLTSVAPAQASNWATGDVFQCEVASVTTSSNACVAGAGDRVTVSNKILTEASATTYATAAAAATIDSTKTYYVSFDGATMVSVDDGAIGGQTVDMVWGGTTDSDGLVEFTAAHDGTDNDEANAAGDFGLVLTRATAGDATVSLFYYASGVKTVVETHTITWASAASSATYAISAANSQILFESDACEASGSSKAGDYSASVAGGDQITSAVAASGVVYVCLYTRDGNGNAVDPASGTVVTDLGVVTGGTSKSVAIGSTTGALTALSTATITGVSTQTGKGKVTAILTDALGATITISADLVWYGSLKTLALANYKYAGTYGTATTSNLILVGKDSAGNQIDLSAAPNSTGSFTVDSSATSGTPAARASDSVGATVTSNFGATDIGLYGGNLVSANCTNSASAEKLTITAFGKDSTGAYVSSNSVVFYCSDAASTVTVTPSATSVVAGATMTVDVLVNDANGFPVADATAVSLVANNGSGISTPSTSTTNGKFKYPATLAAGSGGDKITVTATSGSKTGSATVTVSGGPASVLTQIDALNAKIVALNALIAKIMKKLGVK